MSELDVTLLVELNRWLSQSDLSYTVGLFVVRHAVYVTAMLLIVLLWFSGEENPDDIIESPRGDHRQRALFLLLVSVTALLVARVLAASGGRMAPEFAGLIRAPESVLRGTYPADLTAFWMAFSVGLMLYYRPAPGVLSLLAAGLVSVLAVATGLYFPLDLIAGLAVGAIIFAAAYWLRRWLRLPIRMIILGAAHYSTVFYPLGVLVMLDSTQQFIGASQFIEWLFRVPLVR